MRVEVIVEQNGGEYAGGVRITCSSFEQVDKYSVKADDVLIRFDECIIGVEIKKE